MATWTVGSGKTYATIKLAIDALYALVGTDPFTETQTIEVYSGTYNEAVVITNGLMPTVDYRFILTAAAGNSPIVDGQNTRYDGISAYQVDYVTICGFEIKRNTTTAITLARCNYGIMYNNYCHNNSNGIAFQSPSSYHTVYNNLCISHTNTGIFADSPDVTDCLIYNNTCYYNGDTGITIYSGTRHTVKNNIIWNNAGTCLKVAGTPDSPSFETNYNDLYATGTANVGYFEFADYTAATLVDWQDNVWQDANSISSDPLFESAGGTVVANYKITSSSPCKNKATSLAGTFTTDYYGTIRPQGSAWDIGFHEFIVYKGIDSYTKLMLHCDGADQSTTFIDSSASAHIVTGAATTKIITSDYKFAPGCATFDRTNPDYLVVTNGGSDFNFGSGNFTIDFWVKTTQGNNYYNNYISKCSPSYTVGDWVFSLSFGSGDIGFWSYEYDPSNNLVATPTGVMNTGAWTHCALVRNGDSFQIYINGVPSGNSRTTALTIADSTMDLTICGAAGETITASTALIDELRISKGIARWTADFSANLPTGPYSSLTSISSFMGVPYASVSKVNGVAKANISKIIGVS